VWAQELRWWFLFLNAPLEIYYDTALDKEHGDSDGRWHIGKCGSILK
jgi:hypothetical protein